MTLHSDIIDQSITNACPTRLNNPQKRIIDQADGLPLPRCNFAPSAFQYKVWIIGRGFVQTLFRSSIQRCTDKCSLIDLYLTIVNPKKIRLYKKVVCKIIGRDAIVGRDIKGLIFEQKRVDGFIISRDRNISINRIVENH